MYLPNFQKIFFCKSKVKHQVKPKITCSIQNININYEPIIKSAARSRMAYNSCVEVDELWKCSKDKIAETLYDKWILPQLAVASKPIYLTSPETSQQDAQGYFWTNENELFLTFRGTSSSKDMLSNVNIRAYRFKNDIYIHQGFWLQFQSLENEITNLIKETIKESPLNNITLYIAGHSLGSALAQIAAAYYGEMFPQITVICHTFGCPRTGNKGFVKWFSKYVASNIRVINDNDPVPMIPVRPIWTHTIDKCISIDDDCKIEFIRKDIPWYMRFFYSLQDFDFFAPIQDHSCDLYISRLQQLYDESSKNNSMNDTEESQKNEKIETLNEI
jgi:predicted lipase